MSRLWPHRWGMPLKRPVSRTADVAQRDGLRSDVRDLGLVGLVVPLNLGADRDEALAVSVLVHLQDDDRAIVVSVLLVIVDLAERYRPVGGEEDLPIAIAHVEGTSVAQGITSTPCLNAKPALS